MALVHLIRSADKPVNPGGKGRGLYECANAGLPVPPTWVLPAEVFVEFLIQTGLHEQLGSLLESPSTRPLAISSWRKCFLDVPWPAEILQSLQVAIEQVLQETGFPLVVRSSAWVEDGRNESKAGVYQSCLGLVTVTGVLDAIRTCWASYYREQALHGLSSAEIIRPAMSLLIQPEIRGTWYGVMFTRSPFTSGLTPVIEAEAEPEAVVSGRPPAWRWTGGRLPEDPSALLAVRTLCEWIPKLESIFAGPTDVEWVIQNGAVFLLQARPMTTMSGDRREPFLLIDAHDLNDLPPFDYGEFKPLLDGWLAKKYGLRRYAKNIGCQVPKVFILMTTRAFIRSLSPEELSARIGPENYVVSFHKDSRFNSTDSLGLWTTILNGTGHHADNEIITIGLHELILCELGVISAMDQDHNIYVEYGPVEAHLLGTHSTPSRLVARPDGTVLWHERVNGVTAIVWKNGRWESVPDNQQELPVDAIQQIACNTPLFNKSYPGARVEWSFAGGALYVQDISIEQKNLPVQVPGSTVLAGGFAEGGCVRITNDELEELEHLGKIMHFSLVTSPTLTDVSHVPVVTRVMERLQKVDSPILVADRPSRELAVFTPVARGYIFRQGSLLCHLGILLREAGRPGVVAGEAYETLSDGSRVALNSFGLSIRRDCIESAGDCTAPG